MTLTRSQQVLRTNDWIGTHIVFDEADQGSRGPARKTKVWLVKTRETELLGTPLGTVRWFGRWRKYCFFPFADTVYEEVCLREIAEFIVDRTKDHRDLNRRMRLIPEFLRTQP